MSSPDRFYEDLSAHYHLLFDDWDEAVTRQGRVLDGLIAGLLGPGPKRILDAACGIGTQAIGLALRGHRVVGCDLSPAALARAALDAALRRANLQDLRWLAPEESGFYQPIVTARRP